MGKKKKQRRGEPKFETTFGEMMAGIGVKKLTAPPPRQPAASSDHARSGLQTSQEKNEARQLLDIIADLQQQRRALQATVKRQEDRLMQAAEEAAILKERLRNQETVRQKDLARMTAQRQEMSALKQSNQTLAQQRDALQRKLDARSSPPPVSPPEPPPERSDLRQAAWTLSQQLTGLDIDRLLIVGGSPGYHSQLRELFGGAIQLRLIDGQERRNLKQARADVAWADLTIIWGGTILDHRLSQLYTGESVMTISHRGLIGMMRQLSESLGD